MFTIFKTILDDAVKDITFDEPTHTYTDSEGNDYMPSTRYLSKYYKKFEADKISKMMAEKSGRPQEEILSEWKMKGEQAASDGTKVHKFAEDFFYGKDVAPSSKKEESVVHFFETFFSNGRYVPFAAEQILVDRDRKIRGTADLLVYDYLLKSVVIMDYKTNKDLMKSYGVLNYPVSYLKSNNYNKYTLQLNLYQSMIESLDIIVSDRILIWLTDTGYMPIYVNELLENL